MEASTESTMIFPIIFLVPINCLMIFVSLSVCALQFSALSWSEDMDQGGGVLELHAQELKMPHAMIMQDFGRHSNKINAT